MPYLTIECMEMVKCYGACKQFRPSTEFALGREKGRSRIHNRRCRDCDALKSAKRSHKRAKKVESNREYAKNYALNPQNSQKIEARKIYNKALRTGELVRGTLCEICGSDRNVEGHHPDYSKPLYVQWLCKRHHAQEDKKLFTPHV